MSCGFVFLNFFAIILISDLLEEGDISIWVQDTMLKQRSGYFCGIHSFFKIQSDF